MVLSMIERYGLVIQPNCVIRTGSTIPGFEMHRGSRRQTEDEAWAELLKNSKECGDCLLVTAGLNDNKYSVINSNGKRIYGHRLAFKRYKGFLPKLVRHSCDTPNCIAEAHLLEGTHKLNMEDKVERNRQARGSRSGRACLNEEQVRYIRNSELESWRLADRLGVSRGTINAIRARRIWKHI